MALLSQHLHWCWITFRINAWSLAEGCEQHMHSHAVLPQHYASSFPSLSRLAAGSIPAHPYTLNHLNRLASRAHSLESLGYLSLLSSFSLLFLSLFFILHYLTLFICFLSLVPQSPIDSLPLHPIQMIRQMIRVSSLGPLSFLFSHSVWIVSVCHPRHSHLFTLSLS